MFIYTPEVQISLEQTMKCSVIQWVWFN